MSRLLVLLTLTGCSRVVVDFGDSDPAPGDGPFTVTPTDLDFGTVFVGDSADLIVTAQNNTDKTLELSLSLSDDAYALTAASVSPAAGGSATVTVSFAPSGWGESAATLTVTSAAGDVVDVPLRAGVQEDADGDDVGSVISGGADCDDADPTIYPGAPDEWYDGVDSDCEGNDDDDQDGDGVRVDEDCDDANADVYPGAPDEWYDGADSDCAGNDDFNQDSDGIQYGADCDDTDAGVHPGASDTWYDGIDSDCAGNDDYDRDADGSPVDADCDDLDPALYPGAPETWYDGIDSDCAGDDDYDQDADGANVSTDCDDLDPGIGAPTDETWDRIDNDCNGAVDDLDVAAVADGVLYGGTATLALGGAHGLAIGGDVDGDGVDDLVVASAATATGEGWLVSGATAIGAAGEISGYAVATLTGETPLYPLGYVAGPMVDLTGDGTADVLAAGSSGSYGRAWMLDAGDTTGAVTLPDDSTATFDGDSSTDQLRWAVSGDLDGDGAADVVTGSLLDAYSATSDFYAGNIAIFSAGSFSGAYTFADADDEIHGAEAYDQLGSSVAIADVTGDGYPDVLAGAYGSDAGAINGGAIYVFTGGATTWAEDRADGAALVTVTGLGSVALGTDTLQVPGNLDGDANDAAELVLSATSSGAVYVFFDVASLSGTVAVTSADTTFTGGASSFGSAVASASDLDADGADDLAIGVSGDDTVSANAGAVYVYYGNAGWGSALTAADADVSIFGAAAADALGAGLAAGGDADGDGHGDLLLGATGVDSVASGGGAVYLLLGH